MIVRSSQSDAAELRQLFEELPAVIEDLNPQVAAIRHEQPAARVEWLEPIA